MQGTVCAEGAPSRAPTDRTVHTRIVPNSGLEWATGEQDAEDWGSRKPRGGGVLRGPLGRPDGREHTSTDRASPAPCPAPVTAGTRGPEGSQRTKGHRLLSKQARTEGAEWGSSHS